MRCLLLATALAMLPASTLRAQRDLKEIPDPDPELQRRSFQVAEGFEVSLFASDPLFAKPIQMNFDSAGRLWVAGSSIYPHIRPGETANDKIYVLEDTDGDGKADKSTVFAEGLLIPTGVEPGDGGAYVANSTELLHLADTDGDGRADKKRVVLSGFGTEDTHHILHTFRWGPDGMLYFNQSIYIHSHVETPHGVRRLNAGGVWHLRPETLELDVFTRGLVNPWGHHFDDYGQSFLTDGAGGEGINYAIPGAYYFTAANASRILQGLNPGSPKHCGLEFVSGRHFPDDWQGNIITNDFRAHRVCRFVLSEDGSGYSAREMPEVIKTTHVAFRPIDVKMGPDGALYIADWYNPIIQHGEVDFRDERRDKTHGRIWRVTAKGRPLVARPKLVGVPTAALLDALKAPESWTRHHAKRMLKENPRGVLTQLAEWLAQIPADDPQRERHLLEGLWVHQSLNVPNPALLGQLLRSPDPRVRAAATRVVSHWKNKLDDPLSLLSVQVRDEHPRVRLEAVRALGQLKHPRAVEIAMQALDQPIDRFLDYGLWLTARELEPVWMPLVQRGELAFGGDARKLTFALAAAGNPNVVKPLLGALSRGEIEPSRRAGVLALVADLGDADDLGALFDLAAANPDDAFLWERLESAARDRKVKPNRDLAPLLAALKSESDAVRIAASRAGGWWKYEAARDALIAAASSPEVSDAVRSAAGEGLARLGGDADRDALRRLAGKEHPPLVRRAALAAWAIVDAPASAKAALEFAAQSPGVDLVPMYHAFLQQRQGAAALTAAAAERSLPSDAAKIAVRAVRSYARAEPSLVDALRRAGRLEAAAAEWSDAQKAEFLRGLAAGDPARGEAVFRRADLGCLKCHAVAGAGGRLGPDLASIGASAQPDYLLDSILEPNKQVKENYHSLVVVTDDGRSTPGIRISQTPTELVLRNTEDMEIRIPTARIEETADGGSLMPQGLADELTRAELTDLVRFLSELGKVGPFAVGPERVVRRWQLLQPRPGGAAAGTLDDALAGRVAAAWQSEYSLVSGTLPLADRPPLRLLGEETAYTVARFEIDVTSAGAIALQVVGVKEFTALLDGETKLPPAANSALVFEADAGRHSVTLIVPHGTASSLRVELADVAGSPARAQLVGGK